MENVYENSDLQDEHEERAELLALLAATQSNELPEISVTMRPACECGAQAEWRGPRNGYRAFQCAPCYSKNKRRED